MPDSPSSETCPRPDYRSADRSACLPRILRNAGISVPGTPFAVILPDIRFAGERQIDRIRQRDRRAVLPILAVAGGAVLFIERRKVQNLIRARNSGPGRMAGRIAHQRTPDRAHSTAPTHRRETRTHSGSSFFSALAKSACKPARTANGSARNCGVRTLASRLTTKPATSPKAICEIDEPEPVDALIQDRADDAETQ